MLKESRLLTLRRRAKNGGLSFGFFALLIAQATLAQSAAVATGADPEVFDTNTFAVNIRNREEVRRFFNAVYYSGAGIRSGWNGDVANCDAGITSEDYQAAVLTRINFFRAMAGVPADVRFDPDLSAMARKAALIVSANSSISHFPAADFSCFSDDGAAAAASSNLALGTSGIDSIEAYMLDAGNNYRVGHRRWLLYPQTQWMGNGDIDPPDGSTVRRANANWVIDEHWWAPRPETRDHFVAWPPPGFVPYKLVYPRWSFSFPGADFTNATVTVTTNGIALPVFIEKLEEGFGENTIVFVPGEISPSARVTATKPTEDTAYTVSISGVLVDGVQTDFTYSVTIFDPDTAQGAMPVLSGPIEPEVGRSNRFIIDPVEDASGYDFRYGTLIPFRRVVATGPPSDTAASISALYPLVQTNIVASNTAAFHLAHTTPARPQTFTLNRYVVPSARSELRFLGRLGAASTGQVARVQVSLDSGSSWRDVFAQTGDGLSGELGFGIKRIPLDEFAERMIQVRFEYGFTFGEPHYAPGTGDHIGWYVDDIVVTSAQELLVEGEMTTPKPEFPFVPPDKKAYYVAARPRLFGQFKGEWTAATSVTAIAPPPLPPTVKVVGIRPGPDRIELEFEPSNARSTAIYRLETADRVDGAWTIESSAEPKADAPHVFQLPKGADSHRFFRVTIE